MYASPSVSRLRIIFFECCRTTLVTGQTPKGITPTRFAGGWVIPPRTSDLLPTQLGAFKKVEIPAGKTVTAELTVTVYGSAECRRNGNKIWPHILATTLAEEETIIAFVP
jgi:hypothetical protein